jgi:hypothetical protein
MSCLCCLLTVTGCGSRADDAALADIAADRTPISTLLIGNNVWHYPGQPAWDTAAQAGLDVIRIGGFAYDDHMLPNDWLANWVDLIKGMGAEPMIQVSRHDGPEAAAEVVRNFKVETDNPVRYWNIGNEPSCGEGMNSVAAAESIAAYIKDIAPAMKAVDPSILIYAPDECDFVDITYGALFKGDDSAADISGKVPGQEYYYVDGISWHRYIGFPPEEIDIDGLTTAGAADFLARIQKTRALVDQANAARNRTGDAALQWGIGEFNGRDGRRVCTFENGQMFGLLYGYIMRYGGAYGATWSMLEHGGVCMGTDFSFMNSDFSPRATFYHMQMISRYFSGFYVDVTTNIDGIQAFGAVDPDQDRLALILLNIDTDDDYQCALHFDAVPEGAEGCHISMPVSLAKQHSITLDRESTLLLAFDPEGEIMETTTYSRAHWSEDQAPSTVTSSE